MTARQQEAWLRLGTSDEAAAMRQRMQSAALASDMSAFKAANSGAILEDFVRWHSPRDWTSAAASCAESCAESRATSGAGAGGRAGAGADSVVVVGSVADGGREEGTGSVRRGDDGVLSARMTQGGDSNLWRATWLRATARRASMQAPLFDAVAEGGKALEDLASVTTLDLVVQMMQASLGAFFNLLESSARTGATAVLHGAAAAGAEITQRCDLTVPGKRPLCAMQEAQGATAHVLGVSLVALSCAMQRASKLFDSVLTVAADGRREEERECPDSCSETVAAAAAAAAAARAGTTSERRFEVLLAAAKRAFDACDAVATAMSAGERLVARVAALQAQLVDQDRLIAALASAAELGAAADVGAGAADVSRASPTSAAERAAAVRCLKLTPALATPSTAEFILRHHAGGDGAVSRMYARVVGSELRLATALSEHVQR